jgi:hypothetical protein
MSEKLWATASAVTAAAPTADSTLAFETLKVNGAPHPEPATYANKFSGKYQHRTIKGGIGHNLPQAFAEAIVDAAKI